jgi:hypothetical protein
MKERPFLFIKNNSSSQPVQQYPFIDIAYKCISETNLTEMTQTASPNSTVRTVRSNSSVSNQTTIPISISTSPSSTDIKNYTIVFYRLTYEINSLEPYQIKILSVYSASSTNQTNEIGSKATTISKLEFITII